ncbi:hypothetical protein [Candidatus Thiosymbion oneisti]|uniref:hypothetical protein n=1 Tax=Candidatus Thiosymbion oneisti TaxID=589554 RepID=UPI00105C14C9|nr:hypothetical protein [Candidatus Thiosymbion oneisti]
MVDEIIEELWKVKDDIAREHDYDIDALVADLRSRKLTGGPRIGNLHAVRVTAEQSLPADAENAGSAY